MFPPSSNWPQANPFFDEGLYQMFGELVDMVLFVEEKAVYLEESAGIKRWRK